MSWQDSPQGLTEKTGEVAEILKPYRDTWMIQAIPEPIVRALLIKAAERIPDLEILSVEEALAADEATRKPIRGKPGAGIRGRANAVFVKLVMIEEMKEYYVDHLCDADQDFQDPSFEDVVERTNAIVRPTYHGVGEDYRSVNRMLSEASGGPMTFSKLRELARELAQEERANMAGGWVPRRFFNG